MIGKDKEGNHDPNMVMINLKMERRWERDVYERFGRCQTAYPGSSQGAGPMQDGPAIPALGEGETKERAV
jgi:hypothetical protein